MIDNLETRPSEGLAYWIGVAQSDGCLTQYIVNRGRYKSREESRIEMSIGVCSKSLPMLNKFRDLSGTLFNRQCQIWKTKRKDEWKFHMGAKSLLTLFRKLDIDLTSNTFIPPFWVTQKSKYFGAYLAGLIDGDGDVCVKRPKYPQCAISISSGSFQDILAQKITQILSCSVYQTKQHKRCFSKKLGRFIEGTGYKLVFYASRKNNEFISSFVIPHLQLLHKKKTIDNFINTRYLVS